MTLVKTPCSSFHHSGPTCYCFFNNTWLPLPGSDDGCVKLITGQQYGYYYSGPPLTTSTTRRPSTKPTTRSTTKKPVTRIPILTRPPPVDNRGMSFEKCFATPDLTLDWSKWGEDKHKSRLQYVSIVFVYALYILKDPVHACVAAAAALFVKSLEIKAVVLIALFIHAFKLRQWLMLAGVVLVFATVSCT